MAKNCFDTFGSDNNDNTPHYQMHDSDVLTDEDDDTPNVHIYAFGLLLYFVITTGEIHGIFSLSLWYSVLSLDLHNQFDAC